MINLFTGDDTKRKLTSYEALIKSFSEKTETFFISRNEFDEMQLESFYSGASLFSPLSTVVFSNILERQETRDFIIKKLEFMADSKNSFIFLDGKLNKPVVEAFRKAKAEINIFELPKEKKEKYDNFLVANAFGEKNKLSAWIHFRQAMEKGVALEEVTGVLFWKIKDMIIKRDFRRFTESDLKKSAGELSYLLPQARKRGIDAESQFEQFLLEAF